MFNEEFRTEYALWNREVIHISSIYEVINGKQINKEKELNELREKARRLELFCPCGCKSNVTVVAGPKMERRQHFRLLHSENNKNCIGLSEGIVSIQSRIVLGKWLMDKLNTNDIVTRVPICSVSDTKRKYEFSFLAENKKIAVNYCHLQSNISEEKLSILDENSNGKCIIHIVDAKNGGCDGQFPEHLKKIQNKQNFCLLLSIEGDEYHKARLKAVFYDRNIDKYWNEICFAYALLSDFDINEYGLVLNGISLTDLLNTAKSDFASKQEAEQKKREENAKAAAERIRKQQEEIKKRQEEALQNIKNQTNNTYDYKNSFAKKYYEDTGLFKEKLKKEEPNLPEIDLNERYFKWKKFNVSEELRQQDKPVIDPDGNRWFKCEFCGHIGKEVDFISRGGAGKLNLGKCKKCRNKSTAPTETNNGELIRPKYDPNKCSDPNCDGTWVLKINGKTGEKFWGCSNFKYGCRESKPYRNNIL